MIRLVWVFTLPAIVAVSLGGCGPNYRDLRMEGQRAFLNKSYGAARILYVQAEDKQPNRVENLHDLGACSVMLARERFEQGNHPAALREADAAIEYYRRAIDAHPGHQASLAGLNRAQELKGQFDHALRTAEWAVKFVGPSAKQYIFLGQELEERGDTDGALLRYRQAVAMEPNNAEAHRTIAKFLLKHKNESAAVAHLQRAYVLDPNDPWVLGELAARGVVPPLTNPVDQFLP
jgi:tetratricopeptide (TPR) repeat protein